MTITTEKIASSISPNEELSSVTSFLPTTGALSSTLESSTDTFTADDYHSFTTPPVNATRFTLGIENNRRRRRPENKPTEAPLAEVIGVTFWVFVIAELSFFTFLDFSTYKQGLQYGKTSLQRCCFKGAGGRRRVKRNSVNAVYMQRHRWQKSVKSNPGNAECGE
jgi:hypothetical protein